MNASSAVAENGSVRGDGVSVLVPSRVSLAALCSPSGSPLPTMSKADTSAAPENKEEKQGGGRKSGAIREPDQSDLDVRMEDAPPSQNGNQQGLQGGAVSDKSNSVTGAEPADKMKLDAEEDGGEEEGSDDDEEGEDDDEEEEDEDEEEEEDDDDEDDEEDGSASESGTFQSASEVEGEHRPEGEESSSTAKGSEGGQNVTHLAIDAVANTSTNGSIVIANGATTSTTANSNEKVEAPTKKKKPKRRSPSVDLALPVGPPARPTMRLQLTIAHDDEEPYMTNVPDEIYKKLKAKGHAWADWYASTLPEEAEDAEMSTAGPSNGVDLRELGGLAKLLQKYPDKPAGPAATAGGRKRRKFDEYDIGQYDVRDPFVDDSELGVDEPTHAAKPQADGFFVTQGEVELEKAVAAAQDLMTSSQAYFGASGGKRAPIPPGFGESVDGGGGAGAVSLQLGAKPDNVAIANVLLAQNAVFLGILSPAEEGDESRQSYFEASRPSSPVKRQASDLQTSTLEGSRQSPIKLDDDTESKPKPIFPGPVAKYPTRPVPKRLEREFDMLRQKVAKESWLKKTKFPPDLRDPLMQASKVAIGLGEYNDNFFNWLPHIFPYNKLTLHKYTKRQFLNKHTDYMRVLIEKNLEVLEKQVTETLPVLQREFDEAKAKWTSGGGVSNGKGAEEEQQEKDGTDQQNDADVDGDDGDKEDDMVSKGGEPVKRWRWSEPNREVLFTIVTLDNAIMELKTEKTELENSSEKNSMTNARKLIYKRIFDAWPEDGWTTTTHISREYALYKRKVDRYTVQYHETQGRDIDSAIAV